MRELSFTISTDSYVRIVWHRIFTNKLLSIRRILQINANIFARLELQNDMRRRFVQACEMKCPEEESWRIEREGGGEKEWQKKGKLEKSGMWISEKDWNYKWHFFPSIWYPFQHFEGRWWLFPFYIYPINCKRLAMGSFCGCVCMCRFMESRTANIPYSNGVSTTLPYVCVSARTKIPLHININFEIPIFAACWYVNHLKWLFSLRLNFNSRIDHRHVNYADSILVQCDATLWHGSSIKTNYYCTRMYGIQPNNHAIERNIWLNTSIYLIATIQPSHNQSKRVKVNILEVFFAIHRESSIDWGKKEEEKEIVSGLA